MKTKLKQIWFDYIAFPKMILFHPFDGYEEFKRYGKGRMKVAVLFMLLFAFFRIFEFQYEGILINPNKLTSRDFCSCTFNFLIYSG